MHSPAQLFYVGELSLRSWRSCGSGGSGRVQSCELFFGIGKDLKAQFISSQSTLTTLSNITEEMAWLQMSEETKVLDFNNAANKLSRN